MKINDLFESPQMCPECGGLAFSDLLLAEKKDACYSKVRSRYKVWPSAYASGALVQCRKKGAANWGNKSKNEGVAEGSVNDYFKRRKDEEDRIAGTKAPAKRTPQQSDYAQRRAQEKKVQQGVAEGLSKRDQKDVAAIKAAIERLESQLNQPNVDKAAIQQSIAHEKKRLALYGQEVAEADKHSMLGKIQRHQELKKKVDTSFADIGKAQKAGDHSTASKAFRKHERYANLERPGTWTKSKEQGVAEGSSYDDWYNGMVKRKAERDARDAAKYGAEPAKPSKTLAKLMRIPGFNKVSPAEQQRVAKAVDGYLARDISFERAVVLAQKQGVAEGDNEKIGGRYDPDEFDAMLARVKKLAGQGPMKTVYDPQKRVYRNVPTAVQPKK